MVNPVTGKANKPPDAFRCYLACSNAAEKADR
jgi:hypothetical protein